MIETLSQAHWGHLADAVLAVHVAVAAFIVLGQIAIILGAVLRVRAIRNLKFRITHLALIVFVAAETLLGHLCPLTHLEHHLRLRAGQTAYSESFTQHWITPLIFIDAPWWAFTVLHSCAAVIVVGSWLLVPPDRSRRNAPAECR